MCVTECTGPVAASCGAVSGAGKRCPSEVCAANSRVLGQASGDRRGFCVLSLDMRKRGLSCASLCWFAPWALPQAGQCCFIVLFHTSALCDCGG